MRMGMHAHLSVSFGAGMHLRTHSDTSTVCRGLDNVKVSHVNDDDVAGFGTKTKHRLSHPSTFKDMSFTNVGGACLHRCAVWHWRHALHGIAIHAHVFAGRRSSDVPGRVCGGRSALCAS